MSHPTTPEDPLVGSTVEVTVTAVAHGGHCVARHEGRVLFVRHTLPGERVRARVTGTGSGGRFLRADAIEVLDAAPGRVASPCPYAGPGLCGGCDWQHADLSTQRELKLAVVLEQFQRLAGLDPGVLLGRELEVEPVPGDQAGLRWRTRVEFAVDGAGRPGLRGHRSHKVVAVRDCLIAQESVVGTGALERRFPGQQAVDVIAPSAGDPVVVAVPDGEPLAPLVLERVPAPGGDGEFEFGVAARGFWQVHPGAPATFLRTVLDWLEPQPGERALDLYAGVGLFAAALADAVGGSGEVDAVEGDRVAVEHARDNLTSWPWARVSRDRVDRAVRRMVRAGKRVDVVVLDPPRSGAGRAVVRDVARLRPRAVAYVACDPAALARDVATAHEAGLDLVDLRVFDAFPMTHHMECLALLVPRSGHAR